MNYKELSDKVRYYKETEEGIENMCKAFDGLREETAQKTRVENAVKMIEDGLDLDRVAKYSGLPIEEVRELAGAKTA